MTYTKEQLNVILADHKAYLAGTGGKRANLRGANLRSADLRNAYLRNADLRDADLRNANLDGAYLRDANLRGADLYGANLNNTNLQNANLQNTNLYGADLRNANLRSANLYGADLGSSSFLGCTLRLLGACQEAVAWVDENPARIENLMTAKRADRPDWTEWLENRVGSRDVTTERLCYLLDFLVGR